MIDRVPDPRAIGGLWKRRALDRLKRPVSFVDRAFSHPPADDVFLCRCQLFMSRLGRHHAGAGREDARDDLALVRVAGNNRHVSRARRLDRFLANVETHVGLARVPVGTMAAEARIRHDGAQVAVEAHAVGLGGRQDGGAGAGDNTQDLSHDERAIAGEAGPRRPPLHRCCFFASER